MPKTMNFGCGNTILPNCVNIDVSFSDTVFQEGEAWIFQGLWLDPHEFPANHFDVIMAKDVMEHIHPDEIGNVLYCMNSCMADHAKLVITVPHFERLAEDMLDLCKPDNMMTLERIDMMRKIEIHLMAPYMHGGMGHQSIWTRMQTIHRLAGEGFRLLDVEDHHHSITYIFSKVSSCQIAI